ncbi:hypothetical protein PC121_g20983 [Phytophthora cactorum]|nr:hypothetical protein PC120_g22029 [Phytophthora cactorum]KAG3045929.1 hypothetical protein PC121_g20983 [Phytophthora cactorum]KAG4041979.1 hypothetical protein PC123_g22523 [Phytophthora cactorum]
MWKDVHRSFSKAEARNKASGRGFYSGCVYGEDEDDSTKEKDKCAAPKTNKKRQKSEDSEVVTKLIETETRTKSDLVAEQNALVRIRRERIERGQKAEELATIDGILVRHRRTNSLVEEQIQSRHPV